MSLSYVLPKPVPNVKKPERPKQIGPLRRLPGMIHFPGSATLFSPGRHLMPNPGQAASVRVWSVNALFAEVVPDYRERNICAAEKDPKRRGEWALTCHTSDTLLLADVGTTVSGGLGRMAVRFYHVYKWLAHVSVDGLAIGIHSCYVKVCKGDTVEHYLLTASPSLRKKELGWSLELHPINYSERPNLEEDMKFLFY